MAVVVLPLVVVSDAEAAPDEPHITILAQASRAQGLEGLRALHEMAQHPIGPPPGLAMSVYSDEGTQVRQESRRRLKERAEQIAAQVAAEERARIDAFGNGLAGLERGLVWHQDYKANIAPYARQMADLERLPAHFLSAREAALAQSQPELLDLIKNAPDHQTLSAVQSRYLLNEDLGTATGMAISRALADRAHEIDRAVALGRPATPTVERERQVSGEEPTEEVMYDLIQSVLVNATRKQNEMMARCMKGVRHNDPTMNQACAMVMMYKGLTTGITTNAPPPKILEFEKLGCAPAVGKAGYMCDYTLAVEQQLTPELVGPEAKALLEGATLKSARFIESRKGWVMIYTDDAVR